MSDLKLAGQDSWQHRVGHSPSPALLAEIVRRIVEVAQPERIVLFGSAARGEMGPDSDIDLLIIKAGVERRRELVTAIHAALRRLGEAFDVMVTTPEEIELYGQSPALIFRDALREGRTLYVR